MTWRKDFPKSSTRLSDLPQIHAENFQAIEDSLELEHYSPASANTLSGYHRLGAVGAVFEGTTAQIAALASPQAGAMAYDTSLGVFKYYTGAAWTTLGSSVWSRMRAYLAADITITADASADILVFGTENYDTLSEYNNSTGVFTALASGYYLINANACFVASGDQALTGVQYPTAQAVASGWATVGSTNNWANVDEAIGAESDVDYNITATLSAKDGMSGTAIVPPLESIDGIVNVNYRAKRDGCVCNNECYGEGCACDITCYGDTCTCDDQCYGYAAGCFGYGSCGSKSYSCSCYAGCLGHLACSCDYTCYQHSCTCDAAGYGTTGCGCYDTVHGSSQIQIGSFIRIGGVDYRSTAFVPETTWTNYRDYWTADPSTTLDWTPAGISAIEAFGYECRFISAGDSSPSAAVSVARLSADWHPQRPILKLHVFIDSTLDESNYTPIYESVGSNTYQTVSISTVKYLSAGQTVDIRYQKTKLDDTITAGSVNTNLAIHRLTGPLG